MKTIAVIQARMSSSRLPGKVLADVAGAPMLAHVVGRVRRSKLLDEVVVATSTNPADDPVAEFCEREKISVHRGSEDDVLDRFYRAALSRGAQAVVRITADCPLIDPEIIDEVVSSLRREEADYAANTLLDGLDVEAFTFVALERAWREAVKASEREHVTPYLLVAPGYRLVEVPNAASLPAGTFRWTVDEPQDLIFARAVFAALAGKTEFGFRDVLTLLDEQPDLRKLQGNAIMNEGYYKSLYSQAQAGSAPHLPLTQSEAWFERAQRVVPTGAQTFSKNSTQYVRGTAPIFLQRGKGCRVWDVDGNEYIDYVQGLLPNILGYAHDEVNAAVAAQLSQGHSFSLAHPVEVELAETLVRLVPCAEMVRFGKNGSDVTAGAVRVSRAFTGRERIACCGYHGWQDWFIGSTTRNLGVPAAVCQLTHPFPYNDLAGLEKVLESYPGEFAAVIMEPVNFFPPKEGYLQGVKELAQKHGALLIYDEICSGFHFGLGGAQKLYGVTPDLACFGKAMGNGFPIAALLGRREVMRICEDIFFSVTFGGEVASMAASLKVIEIIETTDALARMEAAGGRLRDGINALAKEAGLAGQIECIGAPSWSLLKFRDTEGKDSLLVRSLFSQELIKRGVLMLVSHNMTAAHDTVAVERTLEAYAGVVKTSAGWLSDPNPARFLEGEQIQAVFRVR